MRPASNQPAHFSATARMHKFNTIKETNIDHLEFHPIIDQMATYIYNASKVIAKYLKPLARNEFTIINTLTFPDLI